MKIAGKRIPKLAATGLMLAGCGDDGSVPEKFLVEELDVLVTEYCMRVTHCYGGHEDFGLDNCRFYMITQLYSYSLLNEQLDCDQAITDWLDCSIDAPCGEPQACEEERAALRQRCPGSFTEGR